MIEKAEIMDEVAINRANTRIAHEVLEKNRDIKDVVFIGIQRRGVPLARAIRDSIKAAENIELPLGVLDITFYRDDLSLLSEHPRVNGTSIDFRIDDKIVILVDDVLYTGRTVRAAIDALLEFGRPSQIQLAVMIDRGHRELPVKADYVGKNVPTSKTEVIKVKLKEFDGVNCVVIAEINE